MEENNGNNTENYSAGNNGSADDVKMTSLDIVEIKKAEKASQIKKSKIIAGIASAVLGLVLLFWPGITMEIICQIVGAFLCITGVLTAAVYFTQPKENPFRAASLVAGIPLALVGLFIFLRPAFLIEFIPIVVGVIVLLDGIANLMEALSVMKQGYSKWWVSLIFAVITIILGMGLPTPAASPAPASRWARMLVTLYSSIRTSMISSTPS